MEQVIIEFVGDTEKLKQAFNDLIALQVKSGELTEAQASQFAAMNQNALKSIGQVTDSTAGAVNQNKVLSDSFKQVARTIAGVNFIGAAKQLSDYGNQVAQAAERHIALSAQIKQNTSALNEMLAAGKANTEQYKRLQAQTAELNREMQLSRDKVVQLSKEFGTLNAGQGANTDKSMQDLVSAMATANATDTNTQKQRSDKNLQQAESDAKEIMGITVDFAKQTSDAIFEIENEARNAKYNAEITNIQKQSQFELNNANLTNAQKAAIQKKFDKEQAVIKLQQWKADQKAKEEQALINGALAVTNIIATMPWNTFGAAQAIAIASSVAATATQVAAIAAQKPPPFAKGTPASSPSTPYGMKLVGEEGPELIFTPGGERIIPALETAKILEAYAIPQMPVVPEYTTGNRATGPALPTIDYNKLSRSMAEALKANPQAHISMDEKGFAKFMVQKGSKHQFLNNKFKA